MPDFKPPPFHVQSAEFVAAARRPDELPPPTRLEIAFAGRSNVGKSSLLNKLLGRKGLARTSSTPGCTRQINFFAVRSVSGLEIMLVDLPGYGYASRSKAEKKEWAELIENYLLERSTLRAAAVLFDSRRGIEQEESDAIELITEHGRANRKPPAVILVATKSDKLPARDRPKLEGQRLAGRRVVPFSVEEPETTDEVWRALIRAAELTVPAQIASDGASSAASPTQD